MASIPQPLFPHFSPCLSPYTLFILYYHQANMNIPPIFLKQTFHVLPIACRVNSRLSGWQTQLSMACRLSLGLTLPQRAWCLSLGDSRRSTQKQLHFPVNMKFEHA